MSRQEDSQRGVGYDLSSSDLDDLWAVLSEGVEGNFMAGWWADKPHQIAYRLLLRLTYAEAMLEACRSQSTPK